MDKKTIAIVAGIAVVAFFAYGVNQWGIPNFIEPKKA